MFIDLRGCPAIKDGETLDILIFDTIGVKDSYDKKDDSGTSAEESVCNP